MSEQGLIDLLFRVQGGDISCRKAAKVIIDTMLKENADLQLKLESAKSRINKEQYRNVERNYNSI